MRSLCLTGFALAASLGLEVAARAQCCSASKGASATSFPPPVVVRAPAPSAALGAETAEGARVAAPGVSIGWRTWWDYNGDRYLGVGALRSRLESPHSGVAPGAPASSGGLVSDAEIEAVLVPALRDVLQRGGGEKLLRNALVSLARVPDELDGAASFLAMARGFVSGDNQPWAEAAVIALGVRGDPRAIDDLLELVLNTERGKSLRDDVSVDPRTRAFAAYALGLLGARLEDPVQRERIGGALVQAMADPRSTYELHGAALLALGLVPVGDCPGGSEPHVCRGEQIDYLAAYFADPAQPADLRAHAVPAMARLAHGGAPKYKEVVARILTEALSPRSRLEPQVQQSCVIALGQLGDGDDQRLDAEIRTVLQRVAQKGDDLARRLALVALAKVAARRGDGPGPGAASASVRAFLLEQLSRGKHGMDAWAALALAVLSHGCMSSGAPVPDDVVRALESSLATARSRDKAAALCLAVGVVRESGARDALLATVQGEAAPEVRANAALSLGLLEVREAIEPLRAILASPLAVEPELRRAAALALRLLGDAGAAPALIERLGSSPAPAEERELVTALGLLGDPRAIEPLARRLKDQALPEDLRVACAAALGDIADTRPVPWTAELSTDLNYGALTWTMQSPFRDGSGVLELR